MNYLTFVLWALIILIALFLIGVLLEKFSSLFKNKRISNSLRKVAEIFKESDLMNI